MIHAIFKASISTRQIIELGHFLPTHIPVLAIYGRLFAASAHLVQSLALDLEGILAGQSGVEEVVAAAVAPSTLAALASTSGLLPALFDPIESRSGPAGEAGLDIGQKISRPIPSFVSARGQVPETPIVSASDSPMPLSPDRQSRSVLVAPARTPSRSPSSSPFVNQGQDSPDPDFPEITLPPTEPSLPSSNYPRESTLKEAKVLKKKKRVPVEIGESGKKKKKRNDIDDIFGF